MKRWAGSLLLLLLPPPPPLTDPKLLTVLGVALLSPVSRFLDMPADDDAPPVPVARPRALSRMAGPATDATVAAAATEAAALVTVAMVGEGALVMISSSSRRGLEVDMTAGEVAILLLLFL